MIDFPILDQMYIEARTFASFLLRQMDRLEDAEDALRDALKTLPEPDSNLDFFLIDILRTAEKYDDAKEVVEAILEREPNDEKALFMYATIYDELGQRDDAFEIMEKIIILNPNHAQALNFVAYFLAEKDQDLDRALELSLKAICEYPEDGYFLDTIGWVYFRRGNLDKAVEYLSRAVNLTGDDPVILEHYAHVLQAAGKQDKALRLFITTFNMIDEPKGTKEREIKRRSLTEINKLLIADPGLKKIADSAGYSKSKK